MPTQYDVTIGVNVPLDLLDVAEPAGVGVDGEQVLDVGVGSVSVLELHRIGVRVVRVVPRPDQSVHEVSVATDFPLVFVGSPGGVGRSGFGCEGAGVGVVIEDGVQQRRVDGGGFRHGWLLGSGEYIGKYSEQSKGCQVRIVILGAPYVCDTNVPIL